MDTIDGMRTFVTVVAEGSFARAAERLDLSPQLVSKYVAQLEERLGARLLNRSTRRISNTEGGQAYYDRCQQVLADIDEMEAAVGAISLAPRGTLRVNAPMSFGELHLGEAVAAYRRRFPEVNVDLTLDDRLVDVVSEGFDLAIRICKLTDSALVARTLAPVRLKVCASPAYLAEHGTPMTPEDLAGHDCLRYTYFRNQGKWRFTANGESREVEVSGSLRANNGSALRAAAVAGAGVVMEPTFIVGDDIRAGRLVVILQDFEIETLNAYALYAHRQYLSAKVRTFVDFLPEHFGSPPVWDRGIGE